MGDITYKQAKAKASALRELGQTEVYLSSDDDLPWGSATRFEPGGCHRLSMVTSGWFTAVKDGIRFRWSFDIETRDANGKGHYEINVPYCKDVISKITGTARQQFRDYLAESSAKVRDKGNEWQGYADRQMKDAATLRDLASL